MDILSWEKILSRYKHLSLPGGRSLKNLFSVESVTGSGSDRNYARLIFDDGWSCIACFSENVVENETFIALDMMLKENRVSVPEIYANEDSGRLYFQSDAGRKCLLDYISAEKSGNIDSSKLQELIRKALKQLVAFQRVEKEKWKDLVGFPPLGEDLIFYDFNYCVKNFFIPKGINIRNELLIEEFRKLYDKLMDYPRGLYGLMYRDFQSRNIMIKGDGDVQNPVLIDFQSCREGPGIYDIISFIWQAKANFTSSRRKRYLRLYADELNKYIEFDKDIIEDNAPYWAVFRMLQVLGAYGLRGLKEGKLHFIESIPQAIGNFCQLIDEEVKIEKEFPVLCEVIKTLKEQ